VGPLPPSLSRPPLFRRSSVGLAGPVGPLPPLLSRPPLFRRSSVGLAGPVGPLPPLLADRVRPAPITGRLDPMDPTVRLERVRSALAAVDFPLPIPGAEGLGADARAMVAQIDDYVGPRLRDLDAPLLVVVGGPTGAGKSTIVNAVVGSAVTVPGVIRPTTRRPVLVHHPDDARWFADGRVLPGLARVRDAAPGDLGAASAGELLLVAADRIGPGIALLDAPDIDSVADDNRALAAQLLGAADLWVFVTSANRYADAVPWAVLDQAAARGVALVVVLNRVPPGQERPLREDLERMLADRGLPGVPLVVIGERAGGIGDGADELGARLRAIAGDRRERARIAAATLVGVVADLARRAEAIAAAARRQEAWLAQARVEVRDAYALAEDRIDAATRDGALLRGEVLARWQDVVGTSDVFRRMESWYSRARDAVTGWFTGAHRAVAEVEERIEDGLHAVLVEAAGAGAATAWRRLRDDEPGRRLLEPHPELAAASPGLTAAAAATVRDWQGSLLRLVEENAGTKRTRARLLSLGLNGVTVALMIVVFASTGGLTGGEIAIAGGSAVIGQKLLETVFGEEAVRRLAARARADLHERVATLLATEAARYDAVLDAVATADPEALVRDARALVDEVVAEARS